MKNDRETYLAERILHQHVERFVKEYSPGDPYRRAQFQADLVALVQAVHHDAMIPLQRILTSALHNSLSGFERVNLLQTITVPKVDPKADPK